MRHEQHIAQRGRCWTQVCFATKTVTNKQRSTKDMKAAPYQFIAHSPLFHFPLPRQRTL